MFTLKPTKLDRTRSKMGLMGTFEAETPEPGRSRKRVTIYSDGACIGNPGPGGYGVILQYNHHRREKAEGFRLTTNNRMELLGVIVGLRALSEPCDVHVITDSEYVVKAMQQGWPTRWRARGWKTSDKKQAKNIDLWTELLALCEEHEVSFEWVRGHQGHPENERCDVLANTAASTDALAIDAGYEASKSVLAE